MDVQPWVALLALGALWLNGLLIAADALKRRAWLGRERGFQPRDAPNDGETAWVRVEPRTTGWARWEVEQRGRLDDRGRLMWHDRAHRSFVDGGEAVLEGQTVRIPGLERAEVWPDPAAVRERLAEGLDAEAWLQAGKGRGHVRTLSVAVTDEPVWVGGRWTRRNEAWEVGAPTPRPLVVALLDPVDWLRGARTRLLLFALATVLALGVLTGLCLWPPVFGGVSTVGGALALLFFLLIQPAGTWIRGQTMEPARQTVGGRLPAALNPGSSPR